MLARYANSRDCCAATTYTKGLLPTLELWKYVDRPSRVVLCMKTIFDGIVAPKDGRNKVYQFFEHRLQNLYPNFSRDDRAAIEEAAEGEDKTKRVHRSLTSMIRITVPTLALLLLPTVAMTEWDVDDFQRRLHRALDLTPEQHHLLTQIRQDLADTLKVLSGSVKIGEISRYSVRERYRLALQNHRVARDTILTLWQQSLLERARNHARKRQIHGGELPEEETRYRRITEALELTLDQQWQWLDLLQRQRLEVQALRGSGHELSRQDFLRLREEHRISFDSILTEEQRLKFERIRQNWLHRRAYGDEVDTDFETEQGAYPEGDFEFVGELSPENDRPE